MGKWSANNWKYGRLQWQTLEANTINNEGDSTTISIPEDGYYTTSSKLRILNSDIDSKITKVNLGTFSGSTTFNVSSYKGYQNFTNNNFSIEIVTYTTNGNNRKEWGQNANLRITNKGSVSYNSATGVVTVTGITAQYAFSWQSTWYMTCQLFLFY